MLVWLLLSRVISYSRKPMMFLLEIWEEVSERASLRKPTHLRES